LRAARLTWMILALAITFVSCSTEREIRGAYESMVKNKMVRIATTGINIPFTFGAGTSVQGFDVDVGQEIGKGLGHDVRWIKVTHDRLIEVLKNGEVEMVISAFGISADRKKEVAFSEPYFTSDHSIARRRDQLAITDLASLAGKKVGVQALTLAEQFMESQKTAPNVTIVKFPTLDDALGALNRTEINAVVGDECIMTYSIAQSFGNLITTGVRLGAKPMGVAVRKEEKKLLAQVNATIERLHKSGELENLRQKWFRNVMELAREERDRITKEEALKKAPKLVTITIIKAPDVGWDMGRLDGFQAELVGASARYSSEPILTTGNRGNCRFPSAIPPGDYTLNMSIFKISVPIKVPQKIATTVGFDLNISSRGINITEK